MRTLRHVSVIAAVVLSVPALGFDEIGLSNWQAAPYWMPAGQAAEAPGARRPDRELAAPGRDLLAVPTPALAFTGISPCRVADTRDASFPAGYGPPFMPGGAPRNFTITGRCGIPASAQAVSFNFTVTNTAGPGFLLVYPQGGVQPTVSTLNYVTGQVVANAAVVPLGATGAITAVPGVSGFNLIIDVNGYYAPELVSSHLIALGSVDSSGSAGIYTNLGTWTSSRSGTGSYRVVLPGLLPGCVGSFPTILATSSQAGFVFSSLQIIICLTGDTYIYVSTSSPTNVAADAGFYFAIYGGSPAPSALTSGAEERMPRTCTLDVTTGVVNCDYE